MDTPEQRSIPVQRAFRLLPEEWQRLEQTRRALEAQTPYRVTATDALRHVINVGSGSVIGSPQHGQPEETRDKG